MTRLLIVACSQAKNPGNHSTEAIERYDGPMFRMLRKARGEGLLANVKVMILSAKYGLIPEYWMIQDYDQRMTVERATQLQPEVSVEFTTWWLRNTACRVIFVNVGRSYQPALAGLDGWCERHSITLTNATGGMGQRLAQTRAWLETSA